MIELTNVGGYQITGQLGVGTFAKVYSATHDLTGKKVAMKIIDYSMVPSGFALSKLQREVHVMRLLRHPNVVSFLEVMEDEDNLYMAMELATGGDLQSLTDARGGLDEALMQQVSRQILSALYYCHSHGVVHRDLKAENVLLDEHMNVKLADFGLGSCFSAAEMLRTPCGSPTHAAPELFEHQAYAGPEVDAWSFGIMLFRLRTNTLPFDGPTLYAISEAVRKHEVPSIAAFASTSLQNLINGLLQKDPSVRATISQAMLHAWTTEDGKCPALPYVNLQSIQLGTRSPDATHKQVVRKMKRMGYSTEEITQALEKRVFTDAYATYHLLTESVNQQAAQPTTPKKIMEKLLVAQQARYDQLCREADLATREQQARTPSPSRSSELVENVKPNESVSPRHIRRKWRSASASFHSRRSFISRLTSFADKIQQLRAFTSRPSSRDHGAAKMDACTQPQTEQEVAAQQLNELLSGTSSGDFNDEFEKGINFDPLNTPAIVAHGRSFGSVIQALNIAHRELGTRKRMQEEPNSLVCCLFALEDTLFQIRVFSNPGQDEHSVAAAFVAGNEQTFASCVDHIKRILNSIPFSGHHSASQNDGIRVVETTV